MKYLKYIESYFYYMSISIITKILHLPGSFRIDRCWGHRRRKSQIDFRFDLDHYFAVSNTRNRNWCGGFSLASKFNLSLFSLAYCKHILYIFSTGWRKWIVREAFGQGCAAALVSAQDAWVPGCQHTRFHIVLAFWFGL